MVILLVLHHEKGREKMLDTKKKLSVVMPAYNEGEHIYDNLKKVANVLSGLMTDYEILAVNDGSKDNTKKEIVRYAKENPCVHPVSYKTNRGKGNAIKCGVQKATGDYIAFLDADLDIPPEQLKQYMECLMSGDADVVIGSKMHKDSQIKYPFIRKCISVGYYCMLRLLFHLKVKDTQTGLKVFDAKALQKVIPLIKTKGYAYDIEILVALNCQGYAIKEMPVKLVFRRGNGMGRIGIKDIIKVFRDTWAIFYRANILKYYQ